MQKRDSILLISNQLVDCSSFFLFKLLKSFDAGKDNVLVDEGVNELLTVGVLTIKTEFKQFAHEGLQGLKVALLASVVESKLRLVEVGLEEAGEAVTSLLR